MKGGSETGQTEQGFDAKCELRLTKQCTAMTLLGAGEIGGGTTVGAASAVARSEMAAAGVEASEAGDARCFEWPAGCIGPHSCAALNLKLSDKTIRGDRNAPCVLQLTASYSPPGGGRRLRVVTLALPRAQKGAPPQALLPAFDQQAAAALLVRMAAQKADSGASTESVVGWLDELLIKMMKSLAQYRKGDPASVVPPPPLAQLPQLIFHLRRSGVLRVAGFSPDRTAAFRLLASSLSVFSTLVLIQPTLTGLEPGRPPAPLPLDSASIAPSRTLLLDTFQQVVLCHGAHVAAWMKEKDGKENPELQKLLDDSRERAAALAANRFPAPERIECTQYSSKARYLTQKLHADVSLLDFLRALYKTTVE